MGRPERHLFGARERNLKIIVNLRSYSSAMQWALTEPSFSSGRAAQRLLGLVAVACAVQLYAAIEGPFAQFWANDFRYFWTAGKLWNEGASPYLSTYLEQGRALWTHFGAPFYYPPSIRPLVALLALAPPREAALLFFTLNIALLALSCRLLAAVAVRLAPETDKNLAMAVMLATVFIGLRQPLIVASIGQLTDVFFAAASLYLFGVVSKRPALVSIGLAILLMKPQFGAGILVLSLLDKEMRSAAMIGVLLNGVFMAAGLANNPAASLAGFLTNMAHYTEHPLNAVSHSSGMSFMLSLCGVEPPPSATLILIAAAPVFIRLAGAEKNRPFAILATIVWGIFAAPTHATDYVMLAPAMLILFDRSNFRHAAWLILIMAVLGRSYEAARALNLHAEDRLFVLTVVNTAALSALLAMVLARTFADGQLKPRARASTGAS